MELNILNDLVREFNFHWFTHAFENRRNIGSFDFNHIDIMINIFIIIVAALVIIRTIIVITWLESIRCVVFNWSIWTLLGCHGFLVLGYFSRAQFSAFLSLLLLTFETLFALVFHFLSHQIVKAIFDLLGFGDVIFRFGSEFWDASFFLSGSFLGCRWCLIFHIQRWGRFLPSFCKTFLIFQFLADLFILTG